LKEEALARGEDLDADYDDEDYDDEEGEDDYGDEEGSDDDADDGVGAKRGANGNDGAANKRKK
jgi:hypothetical protein